MIPCMVGKLAPNSFHFARGWSNKPQREAILGPSPAKTGQICYNPCPFLSLNDSKTRTRVHGERGDISHEEAEGQRTRNKDERIRGTMDAGEDGR